MRKISKKIIIGLLSLAMALSTWSMADIDSQAESNLAAPRVDADSTVTWDCVYFGSYPQTEIVDRDKAYISGVYDKPWAESSDYIEDYKLYAQLEVADYDENGDTVINGKTYRRLRQVDAIRATNKSSDTLYTWDKSIEYHYFRYEPIKWRVLDVDENNCALLLADKILDDQYYNLTTRNQTWDTSTICSWLNGYSKGYNTTAIDYENDVNFYTTAFTSAEQDILCGITQQSRSNLVSLLSEKDADNANYGFAQRSAKLCASTTYAKAMGTNAYNGRGIYLGKGYWWLSSTNNANQDMIPDVEPDGYTDEHHQATNYIGVRPLVKIKLDSDSLYYYAGTTNSSGDSDSTAHTHVWDKGSLTGDCTKDLQRIYHCYVCDETKSESIAAKPHTWDEGTIVSEATCKSPVSKEYTCKVCGTSKIVDSVTDPTVVTDTSMHAEQLVTYDCVYFGSYPQTEIVDKDSTCGNYGRSWASYEDYEVNADLYATLKNATSYDSNGDITIDGTKYRRISAEDSSAQTATCFYNWNSNIQYHYFRYDPIKWRVIKTEDGKATLMADIILDNQKYAASSSDHSTWENSYLRSWLNNAFYNTAFTEDEHAAIITTTIDNLNYGETDSPNLGDTQDKIYLLSEGEVSYDSTSFARIPTDLDEGRRAKSSGYAKAMGVCVENTSGSDSIGNSYWWLRSAVVEDNKGTGAEYITMYGDIEWYGCNHTNLNLASSIGCRPVLTLNLEDTSLYSYAGIVSTDGNEDQFHVLDDGTKTTDAANDIIIEVYRCVNCGKIVKETHSKAAVIDDDSTATTQKKTSTSTSKKKPTIKLSTKKKTLKRGKKFVLKISNLIKGDKVKSVKSNKPSLVKITKKRTNAYRITAKKKKGTATITVTLKSGKKAKCKVIIK